MGHLPQPTPEQLAGMTPDQRQKWEAMLRSRQHQHLQPSEDDVNRLKTLSAEELRLLQHEQMLEIPMSAEEKSEIASKIEKIVTDMGKIGKGLGKWYAITHDDARAKMYFRTVSLSSQILSISHSTTIPCPFPFLPPYPKP